ncbi:MAG: type I-D CRISPR-associated protein Cas7/Csc2 [Abitibacteriaceae bacterium]|nr:type I-D CRISPR-associated protein Cas7/Csc2 [Abditibacteriaceae bacterium]
MSEIKIASAFKPYVVEHPEPLIGAKTIQLIVMREVLDYTVLRTEDTREINTVATPLSVTETADTLRVAFLGPKQKAAESRQLEQMLRTATSEAQIADKPLCYLKDNLCLQCPRCALFGATSTESGRGDRANIRHRIEYSTAFSLLPFDDIESAITFNAINDANQTTGQALGTRYAVRPATLFPSIVTLRSVTLSELILTIKTLLACKSYGAETRIGGDMRNSIFGIIGAWEEIITPLELTLELYSKKKELSGQTVQSTLKNYEPMTGNPDKVKIFTPDEVDEVVKQAADTKLDSQFLQAAYNDVTQYRATQLGNRR